MSWGGGKEAGPHPFNDVLTFAWQMKKELSDNESITQEVVGNAHIENYAIKMFLYADNEDRSGRFHK